MIYSDFFIRDSEFRIKHLAARKLSGIEDMLKSVGLEIVSRRPLLFLMNDPLDARSDTCNRFWSMLRKYCRKSETLGAVIAAMLFPLEYILVSTRRESPTTEVIVCRKSAGMDDTKAREHSSGE